MLTGWYRGSDGRWYGLVSFAVSYLGLVSSSGLELADQLVPATALRPRTMVATGRSDHGGGGGGVVSIVSKEQQGQAARTVRSRLAGVLSDERVAEHMRNRALRLDGVVVTDLDLPAPAGTRIVIAAPEV